jgi:hypothetical protein
MCIARVFLPFVIIRKLLTRVRQGFVKLRKSVAGVQGPFWKGHSRITALFGEFCGFSYGLCFCV